MSKRTSKTANSLHNAIPPHMVASDDTLNDHSRPNHNNNHTDIGYNDDTTQSNLDHNHTTDLLLKRNQSEPLPIRHSPKLSLRSKLIDQIKRSAYTDSTYETDIATANTSSEDVEPPKTLRSNPLWRTITVVGLFVAVLYNALSTFSDNYTFGIQYDDYVPDVVTSATSSLYNSIESLIKYPKRPGLLAAIDGLQAHHPVVFIPGVVSTSLEVWQAEPCAESAFRQRLYGGALMLKSLVTDSKCWLRHMKLDNTTGLDPPGIKLRAAVGLEAADYLMGGYWVWGKIIENFADIGYDTNNMYLAAYDWRLSFKDLQIRDYYFSRLQLLIEMAKASNHNRKVAIIAHSMGGNVIDYFYQWVARYSGNKQWVDQHIAANIHIATPFLGVSKAYSSLFSGEMKDTAELAPFLDVMRQKYVMSQTDVIELMRSFRSIPSMYPKGGNAVWGNRYGSADDIQMHNSNIRNDAFKLVRHYNEGQCAATLDTSFGTERGSFVTLHINGTRYDMTLDEATELLRKEAPTYMDAVDALYSFDNKLLDPDCGEAAEQRHWSNPLSHTLPIAPNMTTYCLHGVGRITERAYSYAFDATRTVPYYINTSHTNESVRVRSGVSYNDGDGTVNLISLGYMCQRWRNIKYNPSNGTIITREYKDKLTANNTSALYNAIIDGVSTVIRPSDSVDHVDIMGNYDMILDLLRIIGKKKQPSTHDRYCKVSDQPRNKSDIIERNTTVAYDDASKVNKLIQFVSDSINTTADAIDIDPDTHTTIQRVKSSNDTVRNNASDLTSAVQPGACLQRHISVREKTEERVDRNIERMRRFMGCDSRTHSNHTSIPDCTDIQSNREQVQVGSDDQSTRDTEHGVATTETDYTHYHYKLYDRYFSCIKEISMDLDKRLRAANA